MNNKTVMEHYNKYIINIFERYTDLKNSNKKEYDDYKNTRVSIVLSRERSLLPQTQEIINQENELRKKYLRVKNLKDKMFRKRIEIDAFRTSNPGYSKKPTKKNNEILINKVINKGGSSPLLITEQNLDSKNENIKITIRIPLKMLNVIDDYLENSIYSKARNIWIKEAIEKKIKEEIENK